MRYVYEVIVVTNEEKGYDEHHHSLHSSRKGAVMMKDEIVAELARDALESPEDVLALGPTEVTVHRRELRTVATEESGAGYTPR